jgi:hypothetical protein
MTPVNAPVTLSRLLIGDPTRQPAVFTDVMVDVLLVTPVPSAPNEVLGVRGVEYLRMHLVRIAKSWAASFRY